MPLVEDRAGFQWLQCSSDLSKRSSGLCPVCSLGLLLSVPPSILQLMSEPTELAVTWFGTGGDVP